MFLDEIGLLPEALQAKLLKVLEERSVRRLGATQSEAVDVWIISATNADLPAAVRERRFREDLYHRLAVVTIALPPLRQRGDDVITLAEQFLARACADYRLPARGLAPDARARVLSYRWPGNVRELANTMERVALLAETPHVTAAMLDLKEEPARRFRAVWAASSLDQAVRDHVQAVLDQTGWNISQSAVILGITRNTLRSRIQKLGLRRDGARQILARRVSGRGRAAGPGGSPGRADQKSCRRPRQASSRSAGSGGSSPSSLPRWPAPRSVSPLQFAPALEQLIAKLRSFGARVEEITPDRIVAVFGFEPVEDGAAPGGPRRAGHAQGARAHGGQLRPAADRVGSASTCAGA